MIKEYDKVKIKATGVFGEVIDIYYPENGKKMFAVESDEKGVPGGYGEKDSWKLFDCEEDELELVDNEN